MSATIEQWALSVASHLPGWRLIPVNADNWRLMFRHDLTGAKLTICQDYSQQKAGRVTVSAGHYEKITLSMTRPAKSVAADILAKIAPQAIAADEAQRVKKTEESKAAALFHAVCLSFERIGFKSYHGRRGEAAYHCGNASMEAYSCKPEEWNLRLTNVSPDTIFKIMAVLEAQNDKKS
jgi:hypothetical protein